MLTREDKLKKIEKINKEIISLYYLKRAKEDVEKGNDTIKVLYKLLLKEINIHNGNVEKRYNKIRKTPTVD